MTTKPTKTNEEIKAEARADIISRGITIPYDSEPFAPIDSSYTIVEALMFQKKQVASCIDTFLLACIDNEDSCKCLQSDIDKEGKHYAIAPRIIRHTLLDDRDKLKRHEMIIEMDFERGNDYLILPSMLLEILLKYIEDINYHNLDMRDDQFTLSLQFSSIPGKTAN